MGNPNFYKTGAVQIPNFTLESGKKLDEIELAYEICGLRNAPVILVCHALTGNQYTVGTKDDPGWWDGLVGDGSYIDTRRYQVITFNVLGGCDGSTGPASTNPDDGEIYRGKFPGLTVRDLVEVQFVALNILGINHLRAVIGGSLGGMQVLEWGIMYPDFLDSIFPIAVTPKFSDYAIAFNHISSVAIQQDPAWDEGQLPKHGLSLARMIGMITYRSDVLFEERFDRNHIIKDGLSTYDIESYLSYQGEKLTERFDAHSYLRLLEVMNSHDLGRERGGLENALHHLHVPVFAISFTRDLLYPPEKMQEFVTRIQQLGGAAEFYEVDSKFGHDGFLVEFEKWGHIIEDRLAELAVEDTRLEA
ncbi:homoserine O-acetyltransferase [Bacillus sp. Marseille-Q3570]|uniref:homoserine O-acetyltransferase MetX n=1 Tax=Bacillus sp. Marseille-Q3570 TaxID=2963522 RepID=UPI0021B8231F|nr:homoserine O-acetyltransferase [Bacillus sp. Marseille-Q3570]